MTFGPTKVKVLPGVCLGVTHREAVSGCRQYSRKPAGTNSGPSGVSLVSPALRSRVAADGAGDEL